MIERPQGYRLTHTTPIQYDQRSDIGWPRSCGMLDSAIVVRNHYCFTYSLEPFCRTQSGQLGYACSPPRAQTLPEIWIVENLRHRGSHRCVISPRYDKACFPVQNGIGNATLSPPTVGFPCADTSRKTVGHPSVSPVASKLRCGITNTSQASYSAETSLSDASVRTVTASGGSKDASVSICDNIGPRPAII